MTQIDKIKNHVEKSKAVETKAKSALELLASNLKVSPQGLKDTLLKTVCKEMKTNEELITFVIVAHKYNLNPLTKEIFAFPDKKGGIVPIVSTDGWTKLMVTHHEYKTHYFNYSDNSITMSKAKPCPEWCEIVIEKNNGSSVVIREYLDEVFRDLSFGNPWQSHTKRMLRHKTKIQGVREAFGFSGVYDQDEAERIIEAQIVPYNEHVGQEEVMESPKISSENVTEASQKQPVTETINAQASVDAVKEKIKKDTKKAPVSTEKKDYSLTPNDEIRVRKIKEWLANLCNGEEKSIADTIQELTTWKNEKDEIVTGVRDITQIKNTFKIKEVFLETAKLYAQFTNQNVKELTNLGD